MKQEYVSQKRRWQIKTIECECGFGEAYLRIIPCTIDDFNDGNPICWYFEIVRVRESFWDRVKAIYWTIKGKPVASGEVGLDKQDLIELRDMIDETLKSMEG